LFCGELEMGLDWREVAADAIRDPSRGRIAAGAVAGFGVVAPMDLPTAVAAALAMTDFRTKGFN
jgi:hypothetical protein